MSSPVYQTAQSYLREMRREWPLTLGAMLLPAIGNIFVFYVPPLIFADALTIFATQRVLTMHEAGVLVGKVGGAWIFGEIIWRVGLFCLIKLELRATERLYTSALHRLLSRDLAFFHNNFAGSLTKKILSYAREFESFADTFSFSIIASLIPLIFISYVLWQFSPWLVVTLLGFMSVTISLIIPLVRRRQKLVAVREIASNVLAGHVADVIGSVDAVRSFERNAYEEGRHAENTRDYIQKTKATWNYQNYKIDGVTSPLYVLTNMAGLFVAIMVSGGDATALSAVFITFTYYSNFTRVMWEFNRTYKNIENQLTTAAQFTELFIEEPRVIDVPNAAPLMVTKGAIEFQNVTFGYDDGGGKNLFTNLNLKIPSGKKIGFVGRSGGGKTTITRLLMRFVNIDDGAILIDGQDIARAAQADVRAAIAYVPQEPLLFHRSIMENIRYGRLDATDAEVFEAAERAHVAPFISQLPQGYDTVIGERGIKLSGGQRQRIAIARAMIKNAPILILDEATSALDSESEKYIQAALWELMKGKTTIVIAHRLSTVQRMDKIIVLDNGKIIEQGTHAKLRTTGGTYAALWDHQSGGFLEE